MRRNVHADRISQRCWGRTSAKNCGTAATPFTGHPKALRPLLLGDTFSLLRIRVLELFSSLYYFPEPLFVSQSSWPWTSFCFRGFWFMSLNPVFMSPGALFISLSPISFPRAPYWAAGALRVPCSLPWIHDVFPCMLYLDYCAHFAVYFLAFLLFPVLLICFLHRSFISGNSWFISPNRYFIVSVFHIDFPEFFSFPYPRASFKVLNFSAYFPEFRRLLYFLVYFDRFALSISLNFDLFLWVWAPCLFFLSKDT